MDYKYCAGVLPFTRYNGTIYFLLGKSRRNNRLTTFSGKNDVLDRSTAETAARECYEETLGAVMDRQAWFERTRKCEFIITSQTPRGMPCYTFVIEVPYRKLYTTVFHKTRDFLISSNIRSHALLEMTDVKFVCAYSMCTKVKRQWERNGVLTDAAEWQRIMDLCDLSDTEDRCAAWRKDVSEDDEEDTTFKKVEHIQ